MNLDFKILTLWFVIEYWWYNTLTHENNRFLNVLVKSNFVTPTPFGSVICFVVGICLSNYNLNSFLIHQASYSKGYQCYLMHREVLGSIWKISRCPIKVSEVLCLFSSMLVWDNFRRQLIIFANSLDLLTRPYSCTYFLNMKSLMYQSQYIYMSMPSMPFTFLLVLLFQQLKHKSLKRIPILAPILGPRCTYKLWYTLTANINMTRACHSQNAPAQRWSVVSWLSLKQ